MNKLIVGMIATAFASTAFAQAAMQTPADKAKQAEVSATTKANAEGAATSSQVTGKEADKLKGQKGDPKALTTKTDKQAAVDSTTKSGSQGAYNLKDSAAASKDKAQKGTPKALPTTADKQKAVDAATMKGAEQH